MNMLQLNTILWNTVNYIVMVVYTIVVHCLALIQPYLRTLGVWLLVGSLKFRMDSLQSDSDIYYNTQ